jgi:hypothetical protein
MTTLRDAPNVRYAEVRYGDDLRRIALRELGSASKWLDLVVLNGLKPPYIADTGSQGVLAYGEQIKIPAPASTISASVDPAYVYGVDVLVTQKKLRVENGDFAIVSGVANFSQALSHRVVVEKRELAFHPSYGCYVRSLLGRVNGPTAGQLAAFYVKSSLLEDSRVSVIQSCVAEVVGDQILVTANVQPISGKAVELKLVV